MRRLVCVLTALAVLSGTAFAAGYGTGTFKGTVRELPGSRFAGSRTSAVVLAVKPGKARITQIGLIFSCPGGNQYGLPSVLNATASSAFTHVQPGPAGGGAIVKLRGAFTFNGTTFTIGGDVYLGLRSNKILGNVTASLTKGTVGCEDSARNFTARRQ